MSTAYPLTDEQRVAATTAGRSVIVSAAAGSGKTTVLAERCAYLVCDAPYQDRCDVDQLLVLTFTDAAATQMRSRIVESLRTRSQADPSNTRLQEEVLRAETAQISTIHSFCLWMIRRWFHEAGTDPMASVLDAQEASVLKREVLEELFERRFAGDSVQGPLLGEDLLGGQPADPSSEFGIGSSFADLIEVYGLGEDHGIAAFVSKLFEFTTSLPEPEGWLDSAATSLIDKPEWALDALAQELESELQLQALHCETLIKAIEALDPFCQDHAQRVRAYVGALKQWRAALKAATCSGDGLDRVLEPIGAFAFEDLEKPRRLSEAQKAARAEAKKLSDEAKDLFDKRIKERYGHFSSTEWLAGMAKTAPFVAMLVDLVKEFSAEYAARKRRLNALDFSDLERKAFELVRDPANGIPSPVAAALRNRFAHILVDEFQDINPIQQAILESVSRERDADRASNLFAVGDVKQSIYRFRLAEPEIFLKRLGSERPGHAFAKEPPDVALFLQNNFRSRPEILGAVNFVFRQLMTGDRHGLVYDDAAELRSGLPPPEEGDHVPVEVHFLERRMTEEQDASTLEGENDEDDGTPAAPEDPQTGDGQRGVRPGTHPSRWDPIQREACLIGMHIRSLTQPTDAHAKPALQFADIAILLRSTKINADLVAGVLTSMGIPAHAQVGGSLLNVREVREVIAALQVLDNVQQDIPLAGVLRSGIFGDRFEEDELVEMRLIDRLAPFHSTVALYARSGSNMNIRERLAGVLARISRYRDDVIRRPLAQTVWNLLERQGYMAYCSGLPNAAQRRANLLKLYDLAHRFSSHQHQGLHRFLRLLESLANGDQSIAVAPASGALDNVVRIMSIHHAKGMEFPVVFVAGLGNGFNLGDRNGRMIFERKSKIGLRAIDTAKMLECPTAVHQLVASDVERCARDEELRVLYVAMTRAQQRLILVGSMNQVGGARPAAACAPTALRMTTAKSPLDWLVPVLESAAPDLVGEMGKSTHERPLIRVALHRAAEMEIWSLGPKSDSDQQKALDAVSTLQSLPDFEPAGSSGSQADQTLDRIHRMYPWLAASSIGATWAASNFHTPKTNDRIQPEWASDSPYSSAPWSRNRLSRDAASERGTLTHRALEHFNFEKATDAAGTAAELSRMVAEGILSPQQRQPVMEEGIAWFASTPLAELIRGAKANYHREFRFVTLEPLSALDPQAYVAEDDRVLVRGIVDGIVVRDGACEIIDFKTDAIAESDVESRCEVYRPQVQLYARAAERLWRLPVRACWLVFLARRQLVKLDLARLSKPP